MAGFHVTLQMSPADCDKPALFTRVPDVCVDLGRVQRNFRGLRECGRADGTRVAPTFMHRLAVALQRISIDEGEAADGTRVALLFVHHADVGLEK